MSLLRLKALYSEEDAKQLLREAKTLAFVGSKRSGQYVTIAGFNGGNGADEFKAMHDLKQFFTQLHVVVDRMAF